MININYTKKDNGFTMDINGHAGSGEPGKDLVCCAVSTLFFTLANRVSELTDNAYVAYSSGCSRISAHGDGILPAAETILSGLETLAGQYPQYISINEG